MDSVYDEEESEQVIIIIVVLRQELNVQLLLILQLIMKAKLDAFTIREQEANLPRRGGEYWWIYTEMRSVKVYIHRSSPTLRGIVVLVFTKSDE